MWLVRVVFLRAWGFVTSVAFLVALQQNEALIGEKGLLPAKLFWNGAIRPRYAGKTILDGLLAYPSLFWFIEPSGGNLRLLAILGLVCSLVVVVQGSANMVLVFICWAVQMSIQSVGQVFYGFGWESQLLEVSFLAMFISPLFDMSTMFPHKTPMPMLVIWGFRWLLFRIMLGAGLIKIRGDSCWRDLTAMNYHYETQPVPNFLSPYFHHAPNFWHKCETLGNHIVELACPFMLFFPASGWARGISIVGGIIQISFQLVLILSGNLSFLNWLTAIPAICCFDDEFLGFLFSAETRRAAAEAETLYQQQARNSREISILMRRATHIAVACLLLYLSIPVVQNLLSRNQKMNASFGSFKILNTYGAFGTITRERYEVVLQGTCDELEGGPAPPVWSEFSFPVKPGAVNLRSRWISPYHFRLDWLMWFAALSSYQQHPWLVHLIYKLLKNDELATSLLATRGNPFEGKQAPKYVKADFYLYKIQDPLRQRRETDKDGSGWEEGRIWRRKFVRSYLPAMDVNNPSLLRFLQQRGLIQEDGEK